jgi:uncharacterized protein YjbI with pentapeptide repeats
MSLSEADATQIFDPSDLKNSCKEIDFEDTNEFAKIVDFHNERLNCFNKILASSESPTPDLSHLQLYSSKRDLDTKTIIICAQLLVDYLFADIGDIDISVHRIIELAVKREIVCYVVESELNQVLKNATYQQVSKYSKQEIVDSTVNNIESDIKIGKSIGISLSYDQYRIQVLAHIKHRIQRDFTVVEINDRLKKHACVKELYDDDLANQIAYAEQRKLTAIVTSNPESKLKGYDLTTAHGADIRVYSPARFVNWHNKGYCDASPEIQSYTDGLNTIDMLDRQAGFKPKYPRSPLPQIGRGWYWAGMQVYSTDRHIVTATIKLKDPEKVKPHTFIGKGNGVISALLNSVDNAVVYLTANQIIKKTLPTSKDLNLFHIIDRDRDVNAKVICTVMFLHEGRYYPGRGKHTDTVKSALYAYASALQAIVDDKPCTLESFVSGVDMGEILTWRYKKGVRDFLGLQCPNVRAIDFDLTAANFSNANFCHSIIAGCTLIDSAWEGANFTSSTLTGNDFTDANLAKADFTGSTLTDNNFTDANLSSEAIFTDAIVKGCVFVRAILKKAILIAAVLVSIDFTSANLSGAKLSSANLNKAILVGADLTEAILINATLTKAIMTNANLTGADLTNANLTDADLTGANLTGANLTGANLTDANLTDAILANVIGAVIETNVVVSQPTTDSKITPNSVKGYFYQT